MPCDIYLTPLPLPGEKMHGRIPEASLSVSLCGIHISLSLSLVFCVHCPASLPDSALLSAQPVGTYLSHFAWTCEVRILAMQNVSRFDFKFIINQSSLTLPHSYNIKSILLNLLLINMSRCYCREVSNFFINLVKLNKF